MTFSLPLPESPRLSHYKYVVQNTSCAFLRSDRPQLSSAFTKNQLRNVRREIFNLKRNRPRNQREQICGCREQLVRAGCKLLRANCQSKYQHCGGSLQSCARKNIRCQVVTFDSGVFTYPKITRYIRTLLAEAFCLVASIS